MTHSIRIKQIESELSVVHELIHCYRTNPMLQKIRQQQQFIDSENYEELNKLDALVRQMYISESLNQIKSLQSGIHRTLTFSEDQSFLKIPRNCDIDKIVRLFKRSPNALELLELIEVRALASDNGFCQMKTKLYWLLTKKPRKTFYRNLKKLEEVGLISQVSQVILSSQYKPYTVKIIRANRIFITEFGCGFKSRCNHEFFAKILKPEWLTISYNYEFNWRSSSGKNIPPELYWAYSNKIPQFTESYKQYDKDRDSTNILIRFKARQLLGVLPFDIKCYDRPSMLEIYYGKYPFWSVELQDIARQYMRFERARYRIPFWNQSVQLPKAIAWEAEMRREQAITRMPEEWGIVTWAEIQGTLAK